IQMATSISLKLLASFVFIIFIFVSGGQCQSVPGIYTFGDSLVDVGNNNRLPLSIAKASFPHNGIDFPTRKATGRFSNGKNSADFVAEKVGLPTGPPYLSLVSKWRKLGKAPATGVSFASGGAGIFNETCLLFEQSISLTQQVDYYSMVHEQMVQQVGSAGARTHMAKSLFMIVIGSNDIFAYFNKNSKVSKQYTPQQYVDNMASILKQLIKRLYGMGARKFAVTGIGMVGCVPAQRKQMANNECKVEANYWATKYNDNLKSLLKNLKSESSDINYSYFDIYGAMNGLIQNPRTYGITEIKEACCGLGKLKSDVPCTPVSKYCSNRSDHFFWDLFHPTETVANLFSDLLYGSRQFTIPMTVGKLVKL
ncbi:GDSL esterase/lipase At5g55050-like, partial [Rutidosis leptorrhynchoides]|uniref:GDSL esterase/lipase At5g55050-like n=1 Tax=Rutidosis leptorrhynchoides TaxID=125765 RepID=UPI003A99CC56